MKKKEFPKPFRRGDGKCRLCHSPKFLSLGQLCPACERYASQDYVGGRPMSGGSNAVDRFINENIDSQNWEANYEGFDLEFYRNRFYLLLKETSLTAQQKQIIKLFFCENLSKSTISKRLELSYSSVRNQLDRSIEKLKICGQNPLLVKERKLRCPRPRSLANYKPKEKILPVKIFQPDENGNLRLTQIVYPKKRKPFPKGGQRKRRSVYQKCWRCGAKAHLADKDFYYCMDCEWNSDTYPRAKDPTDEKSNSPQRGGEAYV